MTERFSSAIRLVLKHGLPADADLGASLQAYIGHGSINAQQLAAQTGFKAASKIISRAVFAVESGEAISIYVPEDKRALLILTERLVPVTLQNYASEAQEIQKESNKCIEGTKRFFSDRHSNQIVSTSVDVAWDAKPVFRAEKKSYKARLAEKTKENLISRIAVPLSIALVALLLGLEIISAMKTFVAAIIAILLAILIEAFFKPDFEYERLQS